MMGDAAPPQPRAAVTGADLKPIKPIKFSGGGPPILEPDDAEPSAAAAPVTLHPSPAGSSWWSSTSKAAGSGRESASASIWLLGEAKQEPLHVRFCPSLSWEDRVMGFLGCYVIGISLSISSMMSYPALLTGHPGPFAWKYSAGNVLGLVSTSFLVGPKTQLKNMMAPVRLGATVVYLSSIVVTLVSAIVFRLTVLTLLAMIIQFCALLWYCASYIPFGRHCLRSCIGRVIRV